MNREEQFRKVQKEGLSLFKKKNQDYGDAFAKFGTVGVLMRIEDKIQRGISITNSGVNLVKNESLRDTMIDLHNYAAMAIMLMDEKNPNSGFESSDFSSNDSMGSDEMDSSFINSDSEGSFTSSSSY